MPQTATNPEPVLGHSTVKLQLIWRLRESEFLAISQSPCMGYARTALPKVFADLTGTLLWVELKYSLHDQSL